MALTDTVYTPAPDRYERAMCYRHSGRSGLQLPEVSLGLWHNFGEANDRDNCRKILHYAFDNGITHFDLANNYGPPYGAAEALFGYFLEKDFRTYRDELFIASKAGYDMWPGPYGNWGSRKYLMASLDQSLKRMHLDYVDLFYSHRYDPNTPLEETLQALIDMVRQGKALYIGISRWPLEAAKFAFDYTRKQHCPCLIYQGRLNMLDQAPKEEGILDLVDQQGVGFISFSPLAQGLLTDRYLDGIPNGSRMAQGHFLKSEMLDEKTLVCLRQLNQFAQSKGQTLAGMALSWILQQKGVSSVIVGASSCEQLAKNLQCLQVAEFSSADFTDIDKILLERGR